MQWITTDIYTFFFRKLKSNLQCHYVTLQNDSLNSQCLTLLYSIYSNLILSTTNYLIYNPASHSAFTDNSWLQAMLILDTGISEDITCWCKYYQSNNAKITGPSSAYYLYGHKDSYPQIQSSLALASM